MRQRTAIVAPRSRLAFALLLAAAPLVLASQLAAQLRPLGDEVVVASGVGGSGCPTVAGRDDGSAVVLRVQVEVFDGELRSVVVGADGSLGADHLLAEGTLNLDRAHARVTATADGYLASWRLPTEYPAPRVSVPGPYAGVALDSAGVATSAPRALDHRYDLVSPRPIGGYAAAMLRRRGIDVQLLSPTGEATSAPAPVVRTRGRNRAVPLATLHRPDGRFTVLWVEWGPTAGLDTWQGAWMRRVSANGRPIGPAVRLLPAAAPGLHYRVSAAIAADGTLALAWAELAVVRPMLQTFTATGSPLGPAVVIADEGYVHALAFGAQGDVLVLWQVFGGPSRGPIQGSLFSRRGDSRVAAIELASGASATHPDMRCADVGSTGSANGESWLVFWHAEGPPPAEGQIFARRFVFDSAPGAAQTQRR